MSTVLQISLPAYFEFRNDDGSTAFCALSSVLKSPDIQERCIDQQELQRIFLLIETDPGLAKRIHDAFETRLARVERPDGRCYYCELPVDRLSDVGPINIRISEPNEDSEHEHEFCSWECFAHYAATQAGGKFVVDERLSRAEEVEVEISAQSSTHV
jgi:hypothetical protein